MEMCPTYNVHCHRQSDGCCVIAAPLQSLQNVKLRCCKALCMRPSWVFPPKIKGCLGWKTNPPSVFFYV